LYPVATRNQQPMLSHALQHGGCERVKQRTCLASGSHEQDEVPLVVQTDLRRRRNYRQRQR
jgi:hypothetical protein